MEYYCPNCGTLIEIDERTVKEGDIVSCSCDIEFIIKMEIDGISLNEFISTPLWEKVISHFCNLMCIWRERCKFGLKTPSRNWDIVCDICPIGLYWSLYWWWQKIYD
jgi:hypothetical protein